MDKSREEFEQWAVSTRDKFGLPFFTIKNEKDKYFDHGTEISWQAWQASRAALVVQLPPQHEVAYRGRDSVELRYALKDAGIKWTE